MTRARRREANKPHDLIVTIPTDLPPKVEKALIAILHGMDLTVTPRPVHPARVLRLTCQGAGRPSRTVNSRSR